LVATGKDGNIVLVNHSFETLLGWKESEVQGKFLSQVVPMTDEKGNPLPELERLMNRVLKEPNFTTQNATMYYRRKDGTLIPVSVTVSPVISDKNIVGAVEVFYDITKEKEIEKLRTDFLSLASHQLRTPLSGTKWLIETLRKKILGKMNKKQKEYLDQIYQSNERMIKLVSDMLNELMLENGVMAIKKQEVSVFKIYEELLLMMEPAAREKGVALSGELKNHKLLFIETDL